MPSKRSTTVRHGATVPMDVGSISNWDTWHEGLAWPVSQKDSYRFVMDQVRRYLGLVASLDDEDQRRIAVLLMSLLPWVLALSEAAQVLQAAEDNGVSMVGGSAEARFLCGTEGLEQLPPAQPMPMSQVLPPRFAALRRMKIAARWGGWRTSRNLRARMATVISSNHLLDHVARMPPQRVVFCHPETIMMRARRNGTRPADTGAVENLTRQIVCTLGEVDDLRPPYRGRFMYLLAHRIGAWAQAAESDLAALAGYRKLPNHVWSGSAGKYLPRLIGLEVMRRGGTATRFSHGGMASALYEDAQELAAVELAASSELVMSSTEFVDVVQQCGALEPIATYIRPDITYRGPDPSFARIPQKRSHPPRNKRRVVYAMSLMLGFKQYLTPIPNDVVYLDWQLRFAEMLNKLPIDLLCKPHPEGILGAQRHPVAKVASTTEVLFEQVMDDADVFVFDNYTSTTFHKAVCTDRPVVLVSVLPAQFGRQIRPMIERRCRIVTVHHGDDNLLRVDGNELAEAVMGGPDSVDPTEIRRLHIGPS